MKLVIIADTPDYLIINKPAGITVHKAHETDTQRTLVDLVLEKYPEIQGIGENPIRPGIVHRLDKLVSGVMVIAKTQSFFENLKKQFQDRTIYKKYIALVYGLIKADEGELNYALHKEGNRVTARPSSQEGRESKTTFMVTKRFPSKKFTLVDIQLHTGRTHQIRSHFLAYEYPIVGETVYLPKAFKRNNPLDRLFLHAQTLEFMDSTGTMKRFECPLPEELQTFLDSLT